MNESLKISLPQLHTQQVKYLFNAINYILCSNKTTETSLLKLIYYLLPKIYMMKTN